MDTYSGFINTISRNSNLIFKEERVTKKKTEDSVKDQSQVCPNPTCGKVFTKPIKVENVSSGKLLVYEACPYCLTEITIEKPILSFSKQKSAPLKTQEVVETEAELEMRQEEVIKPPSTEVTNCKHYFGYLSERQTRDNVPEECMVCHQIVQCMLKGVTQ